MYLVLRASGRRAVRRSVRQVIFKNWNYQCPSITHTHKHTVTKSAQIKWVMIQMQFSLSSRMIKTKIMTPFEAPGSLLQIESNQGSVALFV